MYSTRMAAALCLSVLALPAIAEEISVSPVALRCAEGMASEPCRAATAAIMSIVRSGGADLLVKPHGGRVLQVPNTTLALSVQSGTSARVGVTRKTQGVTSEVLSFDLQPPADGQASWTIMGVETAAGSEIAADIADVLSATRPRIQN